jgi:hypothetical protein
MLDTIAEPRAIVVIPSSVISTIVAADPDDILGKLAAKAAAFRSDASTHDGREAIRSFAAEIRRSKAALLRVAKSCKEAALRTQRAINAEERIIEDRMNEMAEAVRAPLTEYENRDKMRVAAHEAALAEITSLAQLLYSDMPSADIRGLMDKLDALPQRDWEEFKSGASFALANTRDTLTNALLRAERMEAEAAELARLRAEAEERARKDAIRAQAEREAKIASEAAAEAKRRAEQEAERQRLETLRAAAEERARVEREAEEARAAAHAEQDRLRREAEAAAERERLAEQRAREAEEAGRRAAENARLREEQTRFEAEARRVREAEEAERRRVNAERAAVEAERQRAAAAAEAERVAAEKRAANVAHKTKINREILADIQSAVPGIAEADAIDAIKAIARGLIRHVTISY